MQSEQIGGTGKLIDHMEFTTVKMLDETCSLSKSKIKLKKRRLTIKGSNITVSHHFKHFKQFTKLMRMLLLIIDSVKHDVLNKDGLHAAKHESVIRSQYLTQTTHDKIVTSPLILIGL
jgi:hypothetical protein